MAVLTDHQQKNAVALANINKTYSSNKPFDHPNFDEFIKIQNIENVDFFIDEQTGQLNAYKNFESVQSQLNFLMEVLRLPNFSLYKTHLSENLSIDISKIANHIHNNMVENINESDAKVFLQQGAKFYRENSCPFCSQKIISQEAKDLLKEFNQYFSKNYNLMADNRSTQEEFFLKWDVVSKLRKGVLDLAKLKVIVDLHGVDDRIESDIKVFLAEIQKKKDFEYSVDFTALESLENESTQLINDLQKLLAHYQGDLSEKITNTKNKLRDYEVVKKRYSEPWLTNVKNYLDLKQENDDSIKPKLTEAVDAQAAYANKIYSDCMDTVNGCLESLGVNFRVQNLNYKGRTHNDLFNLVFDDVHTVGIATSSTTSDYTSKHTLSESDRRALCFSFFMASVVNDPKCNELIIVLDDPVSSFDADRRNSIVKYIKQLRESDITPCQFIIFTHDKDFLRTLASDIKDSAINLILEWNPKSGTSDFDNLDIDTNGFFMDDYYRKLNELEQHLMLSDSKLNSGHLQNVRHVIESIMKRKYFKLLISDITEKRSIESFIKTLSSPGGPYVNKKSLIDGVRRLLPNEVHHDQTNPGGYDVAALGANDIKRIIKETFTILQDI